MRTISIGVVCPYPAGRAPGQRFRHELFLPELPRDRFQYRVYPFLDDKTENILYNKGNKIQKVAGVIMGFLRRLRQLPSLLRHDYVFIFRECTPLGPPFYELLLAKIFRKKLIIDFDDAIWIPNTTRENRMVAWLKWHSKTAYICRIAYKISAGNEYLADFARQHSAHVHIIPTVVDTDKVYNKIKSHTPKPKVTIGWSGSHSTLPYIESLLPVIEKLEKKYPIDFLIIANKDPRFPLRSFRFLPWQATSEVNDLLTMDIGLMPLVVDPWTMGKCGLKLIQYMALGIPAVATPVGVNTSIIDHGVNGFCCETPESWEQCLERLILDPSLRAQLGHRARHTAATRFSLSAVKDNWMSLFQ